MTDKTRGFREAQWTTNDGIVCCLRYPWPMDDDEAELFFEWLRFLETTLRRQRARREARPAT